MQKITVRNFRQIPYAEIEIKKLLVLVGEQASGKSTLAKLIYFFKSLKDDYFNLVYENSNQKSITRIEKAHIEKDFIKVIQDKFKVYFGYNNKLEDDFEITFYYNFTSQDSNENKYIVLTQHEIQFARTYFDEIADKTITIVDNIISLRSLLPTNITTSVYLTHRYLQTSYLGELRGQIDKIFYDDYSPQFFPAGRNITVSFSEQFQASFLSDLPFNNLQPNSVDLILMKSFILHSKFLYDYFRNNDFYTVNNGNDTQKISSNLLDFFMQHTEYILQGKYSNADGNEKIVYGSQNSSTPLNIASSGQQESVRIIQDLLYLLLENQKSFRIMEEPEAHLYPKAQKNLIELMALVINKTQSQIIITTHSPYVLSILNNLLMSSVVSNNNPNATQSIKQHFGTQNLNENQDEKINLTQRQVQAYALNTNETTYCTSIIDSETGLIGENYLDNITEDLNNDFNTLYHLNFQNQ